MKLVKLIKDFFEIFFVIIVLYFFIRGVVDFYQERIVCDFTYDIDVFNYSVTHRLNLNQVKTFVNVTGFFNNGLILNSGQFIDNCNFLLK